MCLSVRSPSRVLVFASTIPSREPSGRTRDGVNFSGTVAFPRSRVMTTVNATTPKEVAALLVIGDKILSGRTRDKNIGYIAEYLSALGIDLKEVRVVGNEERAIVDALNALRHR